MRRFFAFLGSLVAAFIVSVPPMSNALQGPRWLRPERGAEDRGSLAEREASDPAVSRLNQRGRRRLPKDQPPAADSLPAARPAAPDSASGSPEQSIAVTVQVLPLDETPQFFRFALLQNYPNPFSGSTVIRYSVGQRAHMTLAIYSVLGQQVATLVNGVQDPGNYSLRWDGTDDDGHVVRPGVYVYRVHTRGFTASRKLVIQ